MKNTAVQNIFESLQEFFFQIGLPVKEATTATLDILNLTLWTCAFAVLSKLSLKKAESFNDILKLSEDTEKKLVLFWEKTIEVFGEQETSLIFEESLQEVLSGYLDAMEKSVPPEKKQVVIDFKIQILNEGIKKISGGVE